MSAAGEPAVFLEGLDRILTEVADTGRRLTRDELESRRELGEQAAEAGLGLRGM
ncbi:PucR family transcriptional regulator, partial [Streptomyces sp. UH6]|nr:PucR family transcriptional regulator [Streptomyces sp. UH6]